MNSTAARAITFQPRTALAPDEKRRDFTQIDNDVLDTLASDEAYAVTPAMARIFIKLRRALSQFQEREGVLRLEGYEDAQGEWVTAWKQAIGITGVSNSTLKKALDWMSGKGIIRYDAYKNGRGIRIFFYRATNSIGKKNLPEVPVPSVRGLVPSVVTPLKDYSLDKVLDVIKRPPDGGGFPSEVGSSTDPAKLPTPTSLTLVSDPSPTSETLPERGEAVSNSGSKLDSPSFHQHPQELVTAVASLVNRTVQQQTERYIAQAAARIRNEVVSDTREWLDSKGIPKAVRVAMRESLDNQRKRDGGTRQRMHAHEPSPAPEQDAESVSERDRRAEAECFAAQIECVRLSLDAGRTPEQIQAQFSLDDCTWKQVLHSLNERRDDSI